MTRRLSLVSLAVIVIMLFMNIGSGAQTGSLLTTHVREMVFNGQAHCVGHLPATQVLHLVLVLPLRRQHELANFLQELYDPSSPTYRHFLTVEEFTARFGPSQSDYDAVEGFAKSNSLQVSATSRNRVNLQVTGSVANIEKAFHVTMGLYQHPTENRTFFAPDREPAVDLPFELWRIAGLDNYSTPRPLVQRRNLKVQPEAVTGSCPGQSFCGSDMRAAYYEGTALTGAGQTLGLLEFAGTDLADLSTYYQNAGQTLYVPISLVSTDGTSVNCLASQGCDDTEQTLDMTQSLGMAPHLSSLVMYVGSSDPALLNAMATASPLNAQLSSSWVWETNPSGDDPYFLEFAAQGQTFFQASGDGGGYENSAPWPSNAAYITAVGGTDLETTGPGGGWASETVWSDGGGGWGDNVAIPSWQVAAVGVCADEGGGCPLAYRNVPDVAANANFTFYVCADQDGCTENEYGGTSFAAPMWAGYLALVNQQVVADSETTVGFIEPAIYSIGLGPDYLNDFHDITSGSNGFTCVTGYDLCAGWGSPNDSGLINSLAGQYFTLSAGPYMLSIAQGGTGTSSIAIAPSNGFSGDVTLSASGLPSGVTAAFSPNPTTSTSTLTLTVGAGVATGKTTVFINGVSGGSTSEAGIQLTVTGTPAVTLSPTSLAFSKTVVGETSAGKTVTLKNSGNATLDISSIAASSNFAISSKTCQSSLGAGSSCTVSVTFTPTQIGSLTGTLTFTDNAPNSPQTVALSGTGTAQATLTPANAKFPSEAIGVSSPAKTFTLANKQNVSLTGISISTTGDFSVSSTTCTSSLSAKSSCKISVVFTPTQKGTTTGTLQVSDSAAGSPQTSSLTGTGK